MGTLTSTIISAPINVIADALGAGPSGIVFAVRAFTLAMVLFSPVAVWGCERLGQHRVLVGSLGLMVPGQLGAGPLALVLLSFVLLLGPPAAPAPVDERTGTGGQG